MGSAKKRGTLTCEGTWTRIMEKNVFPIEIIQKAFGQALQFCDFDAKICSK